jgi:hypothetical protein
MSDLTAGRAANGGARGGPVPVTQADRSTIRTPQMIMNARRQRAEAEEQRKAEEERRRSAERRAQAAGVAGVTTTTEPGAQRPPQTAPLRSGDQYVQYPPPGVPRQPERVIPQPSQPQDTTAGASHTRSRTNSQSQQPPRPAQANEKTSSRSTRATSFRDGPIVTSRAVYSCAPTCTASPRLISGPGARLGNVNISTCV